MTMCHVLVVLCKNPVISLYVKVYTCTGTFTIKAISRHVIVMYDDANSVGLIHI